MTDDGRGWLRRHHPTSYGLLSLVFALPALGGLWLVWPDVAGLPAAFPGRWSTVALFSTLVSAGMALRSVTPYSALVDPADERAR